MWKLFMGFVMAVVTQAADEFLCFDNKCYKPGRCLDSPCHCSGKIKDDMCYHLTTAFSYETLIIGALLIVLLIIERIITWRYHIYNVLRRAFGCLPCCEGLEPELHDTIRASNPNTGKTAAFTISTRDFNIQSSDPDMDLAIEFSLREAEDQTRRRHFHDNHQDAVASTSRTAPDSGHRTGSLSSGAPDVADASAAIPLQALDSLNNGPLETIKATNSTTRL